MKNALGLALISLCGLSMGCGDDDGSGAAAAPALTPASCPAAPSDLTLAEPAPVWSGLLVLEASVASGTPDSIEIEIFDPTRGTWTRSFGNPSQKEDGRYALAFSPSVNAQNKDAEFRVRARSRLTGCPMSAWTEGPSFTLGDPMSDTTWTGTFDEGTTRAQLNVTRYELPSGVQLPTVFFGFDGPLVHTLHFAADQSLEETYSFSVKTEPEGEIFDGCAFVLHYSGTWEVSFDRDFPQLVLSNRVPAENPSEGSVCDDPALSALLLNIDPTAGEFELLGTRVSLPSDYDGLLYDPPGPVLFDSFQLSSQLQSGSIATALGYELAAEQGSVSGFINVNDSLYVKE